MRDRRAELEALLMALPAIPTPQQEQEIIDASNALNAAVVLLNAAADALAVVIEATGAAVAGVVTAVGNTVVAGVNLVGKFLGWIGRLFGG